MPVAWSQKWPALLKQIRAKAIIMEEIVAQKPGDLQTDNTVPGQLENGCGDQAPQVNMIRISGATFKYAVGKRYALDDAGKLRKPDRELRTGGVAICQEMTWEDYPTYRPTVGPHTMFNSGNFDDPASANGKRITVEGEADGVATLALSNRFLAHREGVAAIARIDIDHKDPAKVHGVYPDGLELPDTPEGVEDQLLAVLPELRGHAYLIMDSSSAMLSKADGEPLSGATGYRVEIPLRDGSKVRAFMDTVHEICWAMGFGWSWVGAGGDIYERSLVDLALKSPHQPDFAAPELGDGITQDRRILVRHGPFFDPDDIAPLTDAQRNNAAEARAEAQQALKPISDRVKAEVKKREVVKLVERGVNKKRAKTIVGRLHGSGILSGQMVVHYADGEVVAVKDLVFDGAAYDGKVCLDPIEPDYQGDKPVAIFYWNDGDRPGIFTQAHGGKFYRLCLDVEDLKDFLEDASEDDQGAVINAFVLTDFDGRTERVKAEKLAAKAVGLGNQVIAFREDVEAEAERRKADAISYMEPEGMGGVVANSGPHPQDEPLPGGFPFVDDNGKPISHTDNYAHLFAGYGISLGYDVIKKEPVCRGTALNLDTDNSQQAFFAQAKGLAAMNNVPSGNADLQAHLPALAERNQLNPVRDYLAVLEWDGKDRIERLVAEMSVHDPIIGKIALTVWLTGAVAACEHFETGVGLVPDARPSFEYVLAIFGEQGTNKTKGFLGLVPKALVRYAKDGITLRISDKDSVKIAVSYWLAELGELDATFGKGQISELKGFLSREYDEMRLAYAQGYSKYKRRTAFIGTVNDPLFLKDATGNRRFLTLDCGSGFPTWSDADVDQLWAQAWARYMSGAQWWPTDDEQKLLDANAEQFRQQSWAEARIREVFDFTRLRDANERETVTAIWDRLQSSNGGSKGEMHKRQMSDVGAAMRTLWTENGANRVNGELCVQTAKHGTVKIYADGGKNKGWLLPMTVDEVARADGEAVAKLAIKNLKNPVRRKRIS
jgi:predicted P-loop ATPase